MVSAMDAAKDWWNARSSTTGVVFEWTSGIGDLTLRDTSDYNLDSGCLVQFSTGTFINYDEGCDNFAQAYPAQMTYALEHEIGHFLGQNHNDNDPGSGMAGCQASSCEDCIAARTELTEQDAQNAADCIDLHPFGGYGDGGGEEEYEEDQFDGSSWWRCTITVLITVYYTCTSGSCSGYVYTDVLNVDCVPMI